MMDEHSAIISDAHKQTRRITKQRAQDIIYRFIKTGDAPVRHDLINLYNFFTPPAPRRSKTLGDWLWLAVCKNTKKPRPGLQQIRVLDGVAYASDGHRMHYAPVTFEDGYYSRAFERLDIDVTPIRFESLAASVDDYITLPADLLTEYEIVDIPESRRPEVVINDTVSVNLKYFRDALASDVQIVGTACNERLRDALLYDTFKIEFEDRTAIINPMRR